jgi:hypothetical protein
LEFIFITPVSTLIDGASSLAEYLKSTLTLSGEIILNLVTVTLSTKLTIRVVLVTLELASLLIFVEFVPRYEWQEPTGKVQAMTMKPLT